MFRLLYEFCVVSSVLIAYVVHSQCVFDSDGENRLKSTLSDLQVYTKENPIVVSDKNYTYTIGICTSPVKDKPYHGVIQKDKSHEYNLGFINESHIQAGTDWIFLRYKGGDKYNSHCNKEHREAHIMIICDENHILGSSSMLQENSNRTEDCYYLFEITSSVACSNINSGLSTGTILIILFICICFVYLSGGFIYQRFFIGAKGSEQFPNISFWKDFGNLVADGCDLAFRSHPKNESRSYKGIGDDQLGLDEEQDDHLLPM
ncbi:cation-dependent mannose-6-phosphate receptor-like [Antedon mediterranea]|uniref:cation-dependent mannose-6-phosphate receptor-like n=1 Tax=Antedon mediterranea TaxID=105859 RepID=UPI003AF82A9B